MASSTLRRIAGATALGLSAMLVLTGCSQLTQVDELPSYSIIQHTKDGVFEKSKFGYIDSLGDEYPLNCTTAGLFEILSS